MRWLRVIVVLLFILFTASGVFAYLLTRHMAVLGLNGIASKEISQLLGNRVQIGDVRLADFRTIQISDVTLYENSGLPMVHVPQTEIRFSPFGIFLGMAPDNFINSITARDVKAFIVEKELNVWNLEEIGSNLPKTPKTEPLKFKPEIRIVNATVSAHFFSGARNIVSNVTGILDLSEPDMVRFKANIGEAFGTSVRGSGYYDLQQDKLALNLHSDRISLLEGSRIFFWKDVPKLKVQLNNGFANNLDVYVTVLTKQKKNGVKFIVTGDCIDAGADIFGVQVQHAYGRIMVNEKKVSLVNGRATAFGDTLNLSGDFVFEPDDYRDFELNVVFAGKNLHPAIVNRFMPGTVPVDCAVDAIGYTHGKLGRLYAEADAESRNVNAFGYKADRIQVKAALLDGKEIVVSDGNVSAYGGSARFSGSMNIDNMSYQLKAAGSNINFGQIPAIAGLGANGRLSFSGTFNGDRAKYLRVASGNFAAQNISYEKYQADNAVCGFSYHDGAAFINYLNVAAYGGQLSAYGTIGETLNIRARSIGVNGARIAALFGQNKISGMLDGAIDLEGTLDSPRAKINIDAVNGKVGVQKYRDAHVTAVYDNRLLDISSLQIKDYTAGEASASGKVDFAKSTLQFKGKFDDVMVQDIVRSFTPKARVLGAVNGTFEADGTLSDPVLIADLSSDSVVFNEYLAKNLIARAEFGKSGMVLRALNFNILGGEINAEGTWDDYHELDFLLRLSNADIEKLPFEIAKGTMSGPVSARAFLKGTVDEPMLFGKLTSPALVYCKQTYNDVWAEFSVDHEMLDVNQGGFKHKTGTAKFDGSMQLTDYVFAGNIDMLGMDLSDLALTAGLKDPAALQGALTMHAEFSGTFADPTLKIHAAAPTVTSYGMALDDFTADCSFSGKTLTVNKLFAKRGDQLLAGQGTVVIDGPLNMEIGARNIDVSVIPKWAGRNMPIAGTLSATAQISGTYANPDVALSLSVDKPAYNGTQLDEIYGLFTINKDKVTIGQVLFSKAGYKAVLTGSMPYAALGMKAASATLNSNEQLDLNFSMDKADMGILPTLFGKYVTAASGTLNAKINVAGTLADPMVNGKITLDDGVASLKALRDKVEDVTLDLFIKNNKFSVEKCHGRIDKGTWDIEGGGTLFGWQLKNYEFIADTKNLTINTKQFYIPADCSLKFDDNSGESKLSGNVTLRDSDVLEIKALLSMLTSSNEPEESVWIPNFKMDVNLDAGNKLRIYNPILFDMVIGGKVHFGGTVLRPDITGTIKANRGMVMYLRNEFTLDYAELVYDEKRTYWPRIDLQAKTVIRTPDPINPVTSPPKEYSIVMTLKGKVNDPQLKLEGTAGLSQSDILSLLNFGQIIQSNDFTGTQSQAAANVQANLMTGTLQMVALGSVESSVRTNLGLDTFRLSRAVLNVNSGSNNNSNNLNSQEIYQLEIGKYVTDKLLLKSTVGIGYNYYQLMFQYDLWQQYYLTGAIDDQQNSSLIINKIWRF